MKITTTYDKRSSALLAAIDMHLNSPLPIAPGLRDRLLRIRGDVLAAASIDTVLLEPETDAEEHCIENFVNGQPLQFHKS